MLPVGALLRNGTYQVERQLSSGGFGNTYVVKNLNFDTTFAMKEFFMRGINNRIGTSVSVSQEDNAEVFESQRKKFKKEAQRIYRLNCQGITKIYDLFEDNGTTYYVMDYIDGQSLADRLSTTGSLSEAEALSVIKEVLRTLAVVHQQGFTHMDIKPGNIMQDKQGQVYLIDFGASKQLSKEEQRTLSTSTAMPYTEGYAPIEQMNKNMENVGPWTDLYAVGATLYRLLTNFLPPLGDEITTEGRGAFFFPDPVSSSTQELIFWMMEQSRKKRPQSVMEVQNKIAGIHVADENRAAIDKAGSLADILADDYFWGRHGKKKDYVKAANCYRISAEQGNAYAQNRLGYMYRNGYGVAQDYAEALKWYRKAAEQGNAAAQNNLGIMYQKGYGVTKDYIEALKWYRKAVKQGNAAAQNNLGIMYRNGYGVAKDYAEALKWYRKSAEQGNADAQNNLGVMFKNGYGVPKDIEEAKKWYFMAAEQGHENAKKALEQM